MDAGKARFSTVASLGFRDERKEALQALRCPDSLSLSLSLSEHALFLPWVTGDRRKPCLLRVAFRTCSVFQR